MRDSERLIIALGGIDDNIIESTADFLGYGEACRSSLSRRFVAIALAAALILSLCIVAYATGFFGLRGRVVKENQAQTSVDTVAPPDSSTEPESGWIATNGFVESPEAQAFAEWSAYYKENAGKYAVNNEPLRDHYAGFYGAFNDVMRDELFAIADKYNLELHSERKTPLENENFYEITGIDSPIITNDDIWWQCSYIYEDGSFKVEGRADISGDEIGFEIFWATKGTLAASGLYVRDLDYQEWLYTVGDINLELALKDTDFGSRGFIMYSGESGFVTANIISNENNVEPADMEELAEIFDYEAIASASADPKFETNEPSTAVQEAGVLTAEDYVASSEYLAGTECRRTFTDYANEQAIATGSDIRNTLYYAPWVPVNGWADNEYKSLQTEYKLNYPSSAIAYMSDRQIPPEILMAPNSFMLDGNEDRLIEGIAEENYWELMGFENFLYDGSLSSVCCWDNGAWVAWIHYGYSNFELTYIPRGAFCPVLWDIEPSSNDYAYNSKCGEQVYICADGAVLYQTENAYVIINHTGTDQSLQIFADVVDYTKFK